MIQTSLLKNGIRVVTDTHSLSHTVTFGIWVGVGARYETPDINGISHFLEHMAFTGTKTRSSEQIASEIEDVGGYMNAYTGREMTAYHFRVLKNDWQLALNILADIFQNTQMYEKELNKEKGVIIQEIKMYNDTPSSLVYRHFMETIYPGQPMGRPILGSIETVEAITAEKLKNYMQTQYAAEKMVISASGNLNHQDFVDKCSELFINVNTNPGKKYAPATYQGGEKRILKDNEQVNIMLGFQGFSILDPDYYAAEVLSSILADGFSSILFQEIREKRGLVYSIQADNIWGSDSGVFAVSAGTGPKEVAELMPVLCDCLTDLEHSITQERILRGQALIKARILMRWENISTHAEGNARDLLVRGQIIDKQEVIRLIESVTKKELMRVADRIFKTSPSLAALGPISDVMPYEKIIERLKK
ncbi:MAG: insulinase family protein [Lactobacillales bacterium]|jgi:predicted Zn-dependent peptidase|nr:insulinase family protein [Lactobacillales bacterium]